MSGQRVSTMKDQEMELILVYNAESGFFNAFKDGLHKIVSPSTYQCNLCALTYGRINMKEEWKAFIEDLGVPSEFLHRDDFLKKLESHPHDVVNVEFPAIFLNKDGKIGLLIAQNEINQCKTLKDLMDLITRNLVNLKPK